MHKTVIPRFTIYHQEQLDTPSSADGFILEPTIIIFLEMGYFM
jgi:hypothetical protein